MAGKQKKTLLTELAAALPKPGEDQELDELMRRKTNELIPRLLENLEAAIELERKEKGGSHCPKCNTYIRHHILDAKSAIDTGKFLFEFTRGKPAQQKAPNVVTKPKMAGRRLDELSDAELQALAEGADDGQVDSGEAEEASE